MSTRCLSFSLLHTFNRLTINCNTTVEATCVHVLPTETKNIVKTMKIMIYARPVLFSSFIRQSNFKTSTMFDYLSIFDKNVFSLRMGTPSTELRVRCGELIQKATQELHRKENYANILQYGPYSGTLKFRRS